MRVKAISKLKTFFGKKFVKSAVFLFACVFICKILGLIYRIPLTNIVGIEGIGLYQLVFPLYSFLLIFSSNAVPVALSKLIAENVKTKNFVYVSKLKKISFVFFFILGTVFSLLLLFFANEISLLQGNQKAHLGYYFIAPSILLVSLISVFRGIFQAEKNIVPTGVSQVIEQVAKFGFGIILPLMFADRGVEFQVGMSLFAVTISEILALGYLFIIWLIKRNKTKKEKQVVLNIFPHLNCSTRAVFKDLIKTIIPILLANLVVPTCVLIESFLIINILVLNGNEMWFATSVYGAYSGVVTPLINAPVTLIASLGSILIPYVAGKNKNRFTLKASIDDRFKKVSLNSKVMHINQKLESNLKFKKIDKRINLDEVNSSFKLTLLISISSALIFLLFSSFIIETLFPNLNPELMNLTIIMLSFTSLNVISLSFSYVISNILQGIGKLYAPVICFSIFNVLRLIIAFVCLYFYGILAFVIASVIVYLFQFLQFLKIYKTEIK